MDPLTFYMMQMLMANPMLFKNSLFTNNLQQIFKNNININLINSNNFNISPNTMNPPMQQQFNVFPQHINARTQHQTNIIRPQHNIPKQIKQSNKPLKQEEQDNDKKLDKNNPDTPNILNYIYGGQVIFKLI
jgi:hypothetical protein